MTKTIAKRSFALMISAVLFLSMTFVFPQEANAASGKTYYLPTEISVTNIDENGNKDTFVIEFKYDKHGLRTQRITTSGSDVTKVVCKRTAAGALKNVKFYNKSGKLTEVDKYTYKKGRIVKIQLYTVDPKTGKQSLYMTTTRTYKKGKLYKQVSKSSGYVGTNYYYSNGEIKKYTYKSKNEKFTETYNKKGIPIEQTSSLTENGDTTTYNITYNVKTNKNGDITKMVENITEKSSSGTNNDVRTTTNRFKYNKAGKVIRQKTKCTYKNKYETTSTSSTTTTKYKKFRIAKRYQKYFDEIF